MRNLVGYFQPDPSPRFAVVAARANAPAEAAAAALGPAVWVVESAARPVLATPVARRKLLSVGVDVDRAAVALNLVPPAPQGVPFDATFAAAAARHAAGLLVRRGVGRVLLVGGDVAAAFGVVRRGNPLADVYGHALPCPLLPGAVVTVLPHPSGLCRWWNDGRRVRDLAARIVGTYTAAPAGGRGVD